MNVNVLKDKPIVVENVWTVKVMLTTVVHAEMFVLMEIFVIMANVNALKDKSIVVENVLTLHPMKITAVCVEAVVQAKDMFVIMDNVNMLE